MAGLAGPIEDLADLRGLRGGQPVDDRAGGNGDPVTDGDIG